MIVLYMVMQSKPQDTVSLTVIEKIYLIYFVGIFCCFHPHARSFYSQLRRAAEPRKIFIKSGDNKKILPAQQPIRVHILCSHVINKYKIIVYSTHRY